MLDSIVNLIEHLASTWSKLSSRDDFLPQIITGTAATILAAILLSIVSRSWLISGRIYGIWRKRRSLIDRCLESYRNRLAEDTFRVHHPWMKEGQDLDDILVPISIVSGSTAGGQQPIDAALADRLSLRNEHDLAAIPRIIITGPPGSGKTVAMRVMSRRVWGYRAITSKSPLVPVLLTFSEFRLAGFDLEAAARDSLLKRGFSQDPHQCLEYVRNGFREGYLFLFVDGLDEVDSAIRGDAANRLILFLETHPKVAAAISCRTEPYREHAARFERVNAERWGMSEFSLAEIGRFVSKWRFDAPKSGSELLRILREKAHLRDLARNPLMLTIVAYLYGLPKYRLPDGRAEFFGVCARALLEEWDQARAADRANRFDRPHKEGILALLAYRHLSGIDPEGDMDEQFVLDCLAEGLESHSLRAGDNAQLLRELVDNSGMLVPMPPRAYRFPHRTFLEFSAALYLRRQSNAATVLEHYLGDRQRWRETLLLYCGLCTSSVDTRLVIDGLLSVGETETAIQAATEARVADPATIERILMVAKSALETCPNRVVIEAIGSLAANEVHARAADALELLKLRLVSSEDLPKEIVAAIVVALLRRTDAVPLLLEHLEKLDLREVLPLVSPSLLRAISERLNAEKANDERWIQWIDGLKRGVMLDALYHTACVAESMKIRMFAVRALADLSTLDEFLSWLESPGLDLPPKPDGIVSAAWIWPFERPGTTVGKAIILWLARMLATSFQQSPPGSIRWDELEFLPPLRFLAVALTDNRSRIIRLPAELLQADGYVLKRIWRKAEKSDPGKIDLPAGNEIFVALIGVCSILVLNACLAWSVFWLLNDPYRTVFQSAMVVAVIVNCLLQIRRSDNAITGWTLFLGGPNIIIYTFAAIVESKWWRRVWLLLATVISSYVIPRIIGYPWAYMVGAISAIGGYLCFCQINSIPVGFWSSCVSTRRLSYLIWRKDVDGPQSGR